MNFKGICYFLGLFCLPISFLSFIRFDLMGLLFGDILAVASNDIFIIWIGGALILLVLKLIWKPLFASTVNYELAEAEGMNPGRVNAIFTILMAAIIFTAIWMGFSGLQFTDPLISSLISLLTPILTILFGVIFYKDKWNYLTIFSFLLISSGIYLINLEIVR